MTAQCHLFLFLPDVLIVVGSSCLVSKEMELCKDVKHYPCMFVGFLLNMDQLNTAHGYSDIQVAFD